MSERIVESQGEIIMQNYEEEEIDSEKDKQAGGVRRYRLQCGPIYLQPSGGGLELIHDYEYNEVIINLVYNYYQ